MTADYADKMSYIFEKGDWPRFRFDFEQIARPLAAVRHRQGLLLGQMGSLGFSLQAEANLQSLTEEILKSNEIEGEILSRVQLRSSVARRLGIEIGALMPVDRAVEGVVNMMMDATQNFAAPVTGQRLLHWHAELFPTEPSGRANIVGGLWRNDAHGPMQVVSGPSGRERVHYEAPAADLLPREIQAFLQWFNEPNRLDPVLNAAIAHLWLVTIHPFEDGNGRIARALTDLLLARSERSSQRFYSMSSQIRNDRDDYYNILEATQKGNLDVTPWIEWFLACFGRAIDGAQVALATILHKAQIWGLHHAAPLNERQRLMVNKLLDGFDGKLTSSKWAKLTKSSQDTALRDLESMIELGILRKDPAGGRSTSYSLIQA